MPRKPEQDDGREVAGKRTESMNLRDFVELSRKVERICGADSVVYQVLCLEYLISTHSRLTPQAIKRDFEERSRSAAELRSEHENFYLKKEVIPKSSQWLLNAFEPPSKEVMVDQPLRIRRILYRAHVKIGRALSECNTSYFPILSVMESKKAPGRKRNQKHADIIEALVKSGYTVGEAVDKLDLNQTKRRMAIKAYRARGYRAQNIGDKAVKKKKS